MFFQIDPHNGLAIYEQVVRQVKFAVADGAGPRCREERIELIQERLKKVLAEAKQSRLDGNQLRELVERELAALENGEE